MNALLLPNSRPKPKVSIQAIEKMLLRHVDAPSAGPLPEQRLVVAVICHTLVDALNGNDSQQHAAARFLRGAELSFWTALVDLNPRFVREVATQCGYLMEEGDRQEHPHCAHTFTHQSTEAESTI